MPSMAKQRQERVGPLQGTLDMLILRTLICGYLFMDRLTAIKESQCRQMFEAVGRVMWPARFREMQIE
jgi:hypothetical protein